MRHAPANPELCAPDQGTASPSPCSPRNATTFLPSPNKAWEIAVLACSSHYWRPVGRVGTESCTAAGQLLREIWKGQRKEGSVLRHTAVTGPCAGWTEPPLPSLPAPLQEKHPEPGLSQFKNSSTMGSQLLSKRNNTSILYFIRPFPFPEKKKKYCIKGNSCFKLIKSELSLPGNWSLVLSQKVGFLGLFLILWFESFLSVVEIKFNVWLFFIPNLD